MEVQLPAGRNIRTDITTVHKYKNCNI